VSLIKLDDIIKLAWIDHERCEVWLSEQGMNPWTFWVTHLGKDVLQAFPPPRKPRQLTDHERSTLAAEQRMAAGLARIRELWGTG